jgi:hypothetical protein
MAQKFIQVAEDGPGKKVQTFENTIGSDVVEAQAVVPVDSSGAALEQGLTDAELRATPVPVDVEFPATQPVSGTVAVSNLPATQAVSGPLTDTQLRASAVPVSGPATDTQLRATPLPVSGTVAVSNFPSDGALTDTELRATAVPVSGPLTDAQLRTNPVPVSGDFYQATQPVSGTVAVSNFPAAQPVTDNGGSLTVDGSVSVSNFPATQPISAAALPLPTGAATESTLSSVKTGTDKIPTQGQALMAASTPVAIASNQSAVPVSGTFFQATQPISGTVTANAGSGTMAVSAAALPLPSGAATSAKQPALGTAGAAATDVITVQGIASGVAQPVSGTFFQATQPVSAASLPLPAGASTAAKQPALGTAGAASADVLTVQGVASMTALKTDGSAVTQPVSGTVTANIGTAGTLALDATLTGRTQKSQVTDGTRDGTVKAASTAALAADTALVVAVSPNNSVAVTAASLPLPAGAATAAKQPALGTAGSASADVLSVQGVASMTALKVDGSAVTQPVSGTVTITPPTLTKGSQGATGISTQDLKDAGRVMKCFTGTFTAATSEAMVTLTPVADGVAGSTGTTFAVTTAKRLRIVSMTVTTRNAGAAVQGVVCNLRMNPSGAAIVSSPLLATVGAGTNVATANVVDSGSAPLDLEFSGTMQLGVSQVGTATAGNTVTVCGYEY